MNDDLFDGVLGNTNVNIEMGEYRCSACSNTFVGNSKLDKCLFCGSENLINVQYGGKCNDFSIIPFVKNREDAVSDYKNKVMFNPLIPLIFKSKKTVASMKKVYVVGSLCSVHVFGTTSFLAEDHVPKKGIDKYEVLDSVNFDYKDVLCCDNSKLDENLFFEISDYNYGNLRAFDSNYFSDSIIVLGDLLEQEIVTKVSNNVMRTSLGVVKNNIKHNMKKLSKNNLNLDNFQSKKVLVPIYALNVKYGNSSYLYLMNGETGSSTFKVTFGKLELVIFSLIVFALVFLIAFLVAYFL